MMRWKMVQPSRLLFPILGECFLVTIEYNSSVFFRRAETCLSLQWKEKLGKENPGIVFVVFYSVNEFLNEQKMKRYDVKWSEFKY